MVHQIHGRSVGLVVVFALTAVIVTIASALRFYVRLKVIRGSAGYDDLTAGIGWLFFMVITCLAIVGAFYGTGQRIFEIPPRDLVMAFKMLYFYDASYIITNMVIKQSITMMLLRYAVEEWQRKLIFIITFVMQFLSMILFFMIVLQCIPVSFFWTRAAGNLDGRCMDTIISVRFSYAYSAALIVFDFTMALLPWIMVRKLQLDLQSRLMVTVTLALGSIASIATIARLPFVLVLAHDEEDFFYNHALVTMISCAEMGLSIAASSAATLKPLFRKPSSQSNSNRSWKAQVIATFTPTPAGSSTGSSTREGDVEFSTAFYGGKPGG